MLNNFFYGIYYRKNYGIHDPIVLSICISFLDEEEEKGRYRRSARIGFPFHSIIHTYVLFHIDVVYISFNLCLFHSNVSIIMFLA